MVKIGIIFTTRNMADIMTELETNYCIMDVNNTVIEMGKINSMFPTKLNSIPLKTQEIISGLQSRFKESRVLSEIDSVKTQIDNILKEQDGI